LLVYLLASRRLFLYNKPHGQFMMTGQEDLYESGPSGASEGQDKPTTEDPNKEGAETALIPSSLCPGMKPGQEVVLKIEAVHDDQYAVSYAPKEKGAGDEKGGMEEAPMPSGMGGGGGGGEMYS
jgi:hypothetical protein